MALALALSLAITAVPVIAQTTWYVDDDNCPGPGTGTQADPFCTIQDAIDAATGGDTINVAHGTYYENIALKDGVDVLGAGAAVTTIDGGGSGSVVSCSGVGSTTKLDGFTITNGSYPFGGGGGMYNTNSSPMITNCIFSGNSAWDGGGMYNTASSSPTVDNCIFSGNSANYSGGGMYNEYYSSPTVTNCDFVGNSATSGSGGGMYNNDYVSPAIHNNIVVGNTALAGGGIWADSTCSPTIDYNDARNNSPNDYFGCSAGPHDISHDPLFVNRAMGDYHLQSSSPCIDTGTDVGAPTEDIEGNPRPIDGHADGTANRDMGAFEYVPLPSPVGGESYPVSKAHLLAAWVAVAVVLAGGISWYLLRRRRVKN